jgi:hypothetical protein
VPVPKPSFPTTHTAANSYAYKNPPGLVHREVVELELAS